MSENAKVEMKMYFLMFKGCFFTTEAQIIRLSRKKSVLICVICASVVNPYANSISKRRPKWPFSFAPTSCTSSSFPSSVAIEVTALSSIPHGTIF